MFSGYINRNRAGTTSIIFPSQSQNEPKAKRIYHKLSEGNSKKHKRTNEQICWQFKKGNCKNGMRCKWVHVLENGTSPTQPFSGIGSTGGSGSGPSHLSPSHKGAGHSPYNQRIMGIEPPLSSQSSLTGRSSARAKSTNQKNEDVCWNFVRGNCKHGNNCKWKHVKTTRVDGSNKRYRSNHNSNKRPGSGENQHMWSNTNDRLNNLHIGQEARNRRSYALPPPKLKKPTGPWELDADLPAPSKSKANRNPNATGKNPISILVELGQHVKMDLEWNISPTKNGYKYSVDLDGRFLASANGSNKKTLKFNVAAKGLAVLERHSKFLDVIALLRTGKHSFLVRDEAKAMKKEGLLLLGDPSLSDALKPHNKGYKLLLKMGWDPTKGLGKSLQGLTQPVAVELKDNVRLGRNKRGLGFAEPNKEEATFADGAERKVREFANSTLTQLQFSKDLAKEERALIHTLAKKYHLKSKSMGKGKERSLFLFKYTK